MSGSEPAAQVPPGWTQPARPTHGSDDTRVSPRARVSSSAPTLVLPLHTQGSAGTQSESRLASHRHRQPRSPGHWARRVAGGVVLVLLLLVGFSLGQALGRPTSDTTAAKVAEWARDHHLGGVVSFLEQQQLNLHPAKTGGTVAGGFHAGGAPAAAVPSATPRKAALPHTALPTDLQPFGSEQPGEGQWQVLTRVGGQPALEYAGLTPDAVHTSYVASVAWMDPKLLRFELRPGAPSGDPGGTFPLPYAPTLAGSAQQQHLVAAFNAGFRLNGESQGGFYLDGKTGRALVQGAASFVVFRDGTATVGQWGRDVKAGSNVLAVRQNLRLLIDHGTVASTVDKSNSPVWGYTLGAGQYTWRSGVGVTKTGAVVYADGPAMTTRTLAEVLQRAGAVQAMELDINPEWTHLDWFTPSTTGAVGHKLNPGQQTSADKYLSTEPSSRDFFAVFARK